MKSRNVTFWNKRKIYFSNSFNFSLKIEHENENCSNKFNDLKLPK